MSKTFMISTDIDISKEPTLLVSTVGDLSFEIINEFHGKEALELYDKLTEKKKVKHIFEFETEKDWKPLEPVCWYGCPFSFMIKLGERCKCLDGKIECPFSKMKE